MKKKTRQILFFFFAAAFLVSAPLVVLYTAGFRISLNNQRIQQTGAVAVTTSPRGVTVIVDGKSSSDKTPAVVQNILPKDIIVRLEKKDYIPWEQTVQVEAGQTTYVSALLFSSTESELLTSLPNNSQVATHPSGRYAGVLLEGNDEVSVSLYDVATHTSRTLDAFTSPKTAFSISWLADGSLLILSEDGKPRTGYTTTGERVTGTSLTSVTNAESLVTFTENGDKIEARVTDGESSRLIAILPGGTYSVLENDEDYILLRDGRKTLYLVSLTSSDVTTLDVQGVLYDWLPEENLLVWSDGLEVNIIDAVTKERSFITRQSEVITSLFWHPSTQAIVIGTKNHVTAIDTEEYKDRVHTFLATSTGRIVSAWLDTSGKNLYFVEELDDSTALYRRRLVK